MFRDYIKKSSARPPKNKGRQQKNKQNNEGTRTVSIFLFGSLFGFVLSMLLVTLGFGDKSQIKKVIPVIIEKQSKIQATTIPKNKKVTPTNKKTQFDFYTVLPDRAVSVPKNSSRAVIKPKENPIIKKEVINTDSKPERVYYLQAGSFKQRSDAKSRQAEILLLGLSVNVYSAVNNGVQWYRVKVGPFQTTALQGAAKQTLTKNKIDSLEFSSKKN